MATLVDITASRIVNLLPNDGILLLLSATKYKLICLHEVWDNLKEDYVCRHSGRIGLFKTNLEAVSARNKCIAHITEKWNNNDNPFTLHSVHHQINRTILSEVDRIYRDSKYQINLMSKLAFTQEGEETEESAGTEEKYHFIINEVLEEIYPNEEFTCSHV
jgi:hypothetical protein